MDWKHLLVYISGTVDQALLLRNEYLVTENRMLRNQIKGRVRLSDGEGVVNLIRLISSGGNSRTRVDRLRTHPALRQPSSCP
jgi:hypothetical protein